MANNKLWRPKDWTKQRKRLERKVGLLSDFSFEQGASAMYLACREKLGKMAFLLEEKTE